MESRKGIGTPHPRIAEALEREERRQELVSNIVNIVKEFDERYESIERLNLLSYALDNHISYGDQFLALTSAATGFPSLNDLENQLLEKKKRDEDINLKFLLENLKSISAEDEIILEKKTNIEGKE